MTRCEAMAGILALPKYRRRCERQTTPRSRGRPRCQCGDHSCWAAETALSRLVVTNIASSILYSFAVDGDGRLDRLAYRILELQHRPRALSPNCGSNTPILTPTALDAQPANRHTRP